MKKYIFKTLICSALTLSLTTSCELDQYPDGSIPSEKSWEKVSDAQKFYTGLLNSFRNVTGGSHNYVSEVQSDLFNETGVLHVDQIHTWLFTTAQFDGDGKWANNFGLVTDANNILDIIDKVPAQNAQEEEILKNIKGAAYFARAFAYANMLPRYCKEYNEATAASDLGLPLLKTVDVNAKPFRAKLDKTVEFILGDIAAADTLIMEGTDITAPNKNVLTALKARVLLYKKDYEGAIEAATSLFADYPLATADAYAAMWTDDVASEIIFQPLMTPSERGGSYSPAFISYNKGQACWSPSYLPTQGLIDLYEAGDVRKDAFFKEALLGAKDETAMGYYFCKFPGNPALYKTGEDNKTSFYNMCKVFRTSEMYLIAAEASLFKAQPDEATALSLLKTLRENRGLETDNLTGDALVQLLKKEWVREMVGEGFRLDCLKRWGDGVKRMTPQALDANILVTIDNYTNLNVQPGSDLYYKIIWELPLNDTEANGNLEPNWK